MANEPHGAGTPEKRNEPDAVPADLERSLDTEHLLMRHIVIDIAIAVPVGIGVLVGMIAIALSIEGSALEVPLLMAVGIGTLAGVFFGTWAGFVSTAHDFEELDRTYRPGP